MATPRNQPVMPTLLLGCTRALLGCCVAATLAPVSPLAAQAAPDSARLPTVVITADRMPRRLSVTTSTVTVLDGEALRAAGVTHVLDALRSVPGVSIARAGSIGAQTSLFMRGGESDYVRVLVDGVAMNDPGGAIDLGAITLDNVERVEVLRGPASVLYGSDAVAGVIQIFTRQARAPLEASISLRAGTYATSVADGSIGMRHRLGSATLGVAHHASDGMLAFNNQYRNDIVSLLGESSALSRTRAQFSLRHSDNSFHYPTDGAGRVVDRNASRAERRLSSNLEVTRSFGARVEGVVSLGALEVHGRTTDLSDGVADTLGFFSYRSVGVVRRRNADARLIVHPLAGQSMSVGVEYGAERQRSADSSNYDVSRNHFAASRITRALYAQWVGDAGRASYSLGARYDDNDAYGVFRTARVGAAYRLWTGARARGAVGAGFKAPTFFETFSTAFSVGNQALRPERSRAWEASIEQQLAGGRVGVSVTYFDQRFRDLIQYTYRSPLEPNYFNVAAASSRGLEVEARGDASRGVTLWGNVTALRTRVDNAGFQSGAGATFVNGGRLLRRPPLTLTAGALFSRLPRTRLDLAVTRVGSRDDRNFASFPAKPVVLSSYSRVDLGGDFTPRFGQGFWRSTAITLRVENVLAADYQDIANFAAPGRVILAGLRLGTMR